MSKKLTAKQKEAIDFFKNYKRMFGHYPTFEQAGEALGVAGQVVHSRIKLAEKKGVELERYKVNKKTDQ